jgi:uncharacterized membrane protein
LFFLLSALVGFVVAARISYLPLLILLPLCMSVNTKPDLRVRLQLLLTGVAIALIPIAATFVLVASVKVPFRANEGVSIAGQLSFLWHQPSAIPTIVKNTFTMYWKQHLMELIGKFGWLDTALPTRIYFAAGTTILLACMMHILAGRSSIQRAYRLVPVAIAISAIALTYVVLYLSWTPVGLLFVDGVQGRYWLPPVLIIALALPTLPLPTLPSSTYLPIPSIPQNCAAIFGWAFIYCFAFSNLWSIPRAILTRYYG